MIVRALSFYKTTIGKKMVVAITGLILFGFLIAHMAGNLQVFLGQEVFDGYAAKLKSMPELLWGTRIVLLVALVLHMMTVGHLWARNRRARTQNYRRLKQMNPNWASRWMYVTGPLLLFFIIYHLLHFTVGTAHHTAPNFDHATVYYNVVTAFSQPAVFAVYLVSMIILCGHLIHGVWSLFQTIGLNHPRYNQLRWLVGIGFTGLVVLGFIAVPTGVFLGLVSL